MQSKGISSLSLSLSLSFSQYPKLMMPTKQTESIAIDRVIIIISFISYSPVSPVSSLCDRDLQDDIQSI